MNFKIDDYVITTVDLNSRIKKRSVEKGTVGQIKFLFSKPDVLGVIFYNELKYMVYVDEVKKINLESKLVSYGSETGLSSF